PARESGTAGTLRRWPGRYRGRPRCRPSGAASTTVPDGPAVLPSYLDPALDGVDDLGHGVVDRHAVVLRPVAVPERHGVLGAIFVARDEHVWHLLLLRGADLLLHPVVAGVDLGSDPPRPQPLRDVP